MRRRSPARKQQLRRYRPTATASVSGRNCVRGGVVGATAGRGGPTAAATATVQDAAARQQLDGTGFQAVLADAAHAVGPVQHAQQDGRGDRVYAAADDDDAAARPRPFRVRVQLVAAPAEALAVGPVPGRLHRERLQQPVAERPVAVALAHPAFVRRLYRRTATDAAPATAVVSAVVATTTTGPDPASWPAGHVPDQRARISGLALGLGRRRPSAPSPTSRVQELFDGVVFRCRISRRPHRRSAQVARRDRVRGTVSRSRQPLVAVRQTSQHTR